MAAYLIVDVDVSDAARYEEYKKLAPPAIAAYGGKYLVRGGACEVLEGTFPAKRVVVLEFPSADQARKFYHSSEYGAAKRARAGAARMNMLLVEGA
jgi:uncharacterized protein (DUF1330 family)